MSRISGVVIALVIGAMSARAQIDSAGIGALYRDWSMALVQRGAAGYASYFATDAALLPPDAAPVTGRSAIEAWMADQLARAPYTTKVDAITVDEVRVMGDAAVHRSTLRGSRVRKSDGVSTPFEAKYFDVLRRKPDRSWEFVYRMWSSNLPPQ